MGMVVVAFLATSAGGPDETTIKSTLRRTRSAASSGSALILLLGKSILDGDIFSLNPAKLAQLLPEPVQEDGVAGSCAWLQVSDAEDFPCCCASALAPHTVSATTITKSPAHFRFSILDRRLSDRKLEDRMQVLSCICFSPQSKIANHLIILFARYSTDCRIVSQDLWRS